MRSNRAIRYPLKSLGCLCMLLTCISVQRSTAGQPNVVLIHVDDLDFDEVAAYDGAGWVHSPNMDRLINGGIKFTRAYVNSPVCVPSRYGTLTGRYASRCDAFIKHSSDKILSIENVDNRTTVAPTIGPSEWTLARMMASAGYVTAMTGKYHNDFECDQRPIQHIQGDPEDPRVASEIAANYAQIVARVKRDTGFEVVDRLYYNNKEQFVPGSRALQVNNTPWITEGAIEFLRNRPRDKPFFLYYSNPIPHGRIATRAARTNKNGDPLPSKGSPNFLKNMVERSSLATPAGFLSEEPKVQPSRKDAIARAKRYAPKGHPNNSLITWLDDSIGALIQELNSQRILEDTLIIFHSDHQSRAKFTVYENGANIPMAIYWKETIQPATCDSLVANIDILPTLAELCGGELPPGRKIDGVSLVDLFHSPEQKVRQSLLIELGFARAVVTEQWKYIAIRFPVGVEPATAENTVQVSGLRRPQKKLQVEAYPHYASADQLFDLTNDPHEQRNLFGLQQHHAISEEMKSHLAQILKTLPHGFGDLK